MRSLLVLQLALWIGALHLLIGQVVAAVDRWPALGEDTRARRWCELAVVVVFAALAANPFVTKMIVNGLESGLVVPIGAALLAFALRFRGRFVSRATRGQRYLAGGLLRPRVPRPHGLGDPHRFGRRVVPARRRHPTRPRPVLDAGTANGRGPGRPGRGGRGVPGVQPGVVRHRTAGLRHGQAAPAHAASGAARAGLGRARRGGPARRSPTDQGELAGEASPPLPVGTAWYATFCVGLLGYYTTLQSVPYLWYFAPLALEAMWLAMLFAADLAEGAVARRPGPGIAGPGRGAQRPRRRRHAPPVAILAVPLLVALVWSIKSYVDPGARALMVHDAKAGAWISTHLPPDARVASWDAGVIGYFAQRRVVNLDGVVNSIEYYRATQDGTVARFLADRDVRWVANHGGDVTAPTRGSTGRSATTSEGPGRDRSPSSTATPTTTRAHSTDRGPIRRASAWAPTCTDSSPDARLPCEQFWVPISTVTRSKPAPKC